MNFINFDSEVMEMKEIEGRMIVKIAPAIYEIRTRKNGKFYKYCLSNKQKDQKIQELLDVFENGI